jgi:hypothetical protein
MKNDNPLIVFKEKVTRKTEKAGINLRVHSTVYLAVNAFLFFINMTTSGHFPWFYFPLAGWGIGLVAHVRHFLNLHHKKSYLAAIKDCAQEQFKTIKSLLNGIGGFRQHLTAFLAVNGFLLGTNLITSAHYPWFLFPLGGWSIGLLAHWASFSAHRKILISRLQEQGLSWKDLQAIQPFPGSAKNGAMVNGYAEILIQTSEIKDYLLNQLETNKEFRNQFREEVRPLLDKFGKQISELVQHKSEIEEALSAVSEAELLAEMKTLREKQQQSDNPLLKREYENSLIQYEHHLETIDELKNQQELIALRLNSSLTALKQLKLDAARLKSASSLQESYSLKELKNKSQELSSYLKDLKDSYKDLDLK